VPYISENRRRQIDRGISEPISAGELNYALTRVVARYIESQGLQYRTINDVVGALEGAKLEFYRRVAVPYEDGKIATNGDVYTQENVPEPAPMVCENCTD
jgi:hypothetical protein